VKGKIVVITQPMVRAQDGAGYGVAGISRRAGPSRPPSAAPSAC
jgi:hypothetical protein